MLWAVNSFEPGQISGKFLKAWDVILQNKNFSKPDTLFYKKKKVLRPDTFNLRLFFFSWPTGGWKKTKVSWHNKRFGRDGNEHNIFLLRGGEEEKKSFFAQQKDLGELATSTIYFFLVRLFFRVVWPLVGVCNVFEKILVTSFVFPALNTLRFSWADFQDFSLFLSRSHKVSKKS